MTSLADLPGAAMLALARGQGLTVRFAIDPIFGRVVMVRGTWEQRHLIVDLLRYTDTLAVALVSERRPQERAA